MGEGEGGGPGAGIGAFLRAPLAARTWREFGHLLSGLPLSLVYFSLAITGVGLGAGLFFTFLGVPVLAGALALCREFGHLERARARSLLGVEIADPAPIRARESGALSAMGALLKSGSAWRHVLYCVVHVPFAAFGFGVALVFVTTGGACLSYPLWFWVFPAFTDQPGLQLFQRDDYAFFADSPAAIALTSLIGLAFTLATPWVVRALTTVDRFLVSGLLGPSRPDTRLIERESGRGAVADSAGADLRRVERDLHDGAQARLAALSTGLGRAKEKLLEDPQGPERAAAMVDEARSEVNLTLRELRELARGVHPAVLTGRGLDAALSAVASRCAVPVRVAVDLPARPTAAIEGIAYFAVAELLQNISKHARSASVDVWKARERLLLQVSDDGGTTATAELPWRS
ncbi:sensor domain-containing protein [Streptomyces sp. NPDC006544]|uniref:sensor histidine kinase n=1 Tax=Streptomyces sp. NPDC006544 TaxID=3154583 RepID=UPI0033ACB4F8